MKAALIRVDLTVVPQKQPAEGKTDAMPSHVRSGQSSIDACAHVCMYIWIDGWMDGWLAGWVGGWVGGWMHGWMDGCMESPLRAKGPEHV